jgi:hypothetical protein
LQATYSYARRFGFDSERTIGRAIKELISHGFIYRSRSGGYQQGAAQYAVTWLSVTRKEGLFLSGYKPYAWRDWMPSEKNIPPAKRLDAHGKNVLSSTLAQDKNAGGTPRKSADIELMPCREVVSSPRPRGRQAPTPFAIRLQTNADRGALCFH